MADLFKVEAESSNIISVAAATTEDEDEAVSSLKRRKGSIPDGDSGSSSSSLHMYKDPVDNLADTATEKTNTRGSSNPCQREEPILLNS